MNRIFEQQLLLLHFIPLCFNITAFCSAIDKSCVPSNKPIAYFASKKEASLIGSGEVKVDNNNEFFFYGFSTNNTILTRYLRSKIPLVLIVLHKTKCTNYENELALAMQKIMVDFYENNPTSDPCDTNSQHVLLSLLHLIDRKKTIFTLECTQGLFQQNYGAINGKINPVRPRKSFTPILRADALSTSIQSSIYSLIKTNEISQKSMCKRPQELINKIIATDTNEFLDGIIHLSESDWLQKCNHPSTTKEYQSLKTKWLQLHQGADLTTVINDATDLEKSILLRWNHNRDELLKFAAILRQKSTVCTSALLFVDDLIEQASLTPIPPKPEPSCLASILALFTNDSEN